MVFPFPGSGESTSVLLPTISGHRCLTAGVLPSQSFRISSWSVFPRPKSMPVSIPSSFLVLKALPRGVLRKYKKSKVTQNLNYPGYNNLLPYPFETFPILANTNLQPTFATYYKVQHPIIIHIYSRGTIRVVNYWDFYTIPEKTISIVNKNL